MKRQPRRRQPHLKRQKLPSVRQVLSIDYVCTACFMFSLILCLVAFVGTAADGKLAPSFIQIAPWLIPLGFGITYWRVSSIYRTLEHGDVVEGRISNIRFLQNSVHLEYSYRYQDRSYFRRYYTNSSPGLKTLSVGDEVEVMVDAKSPDTGLVKTLFL